jgi:5-methylcytosine-specific restriction endonuclease McrA
MAEVTRTCRRCQADISHLRRDAVWCGRCPKRIPQQLERRTCDICDQSFQPRRKDAVCCSRLCNARRLNRMYARARRGEPQAHTCPACAREFMPARSDQRYCSATCGARGRYKRVKLEDVACIYCGKIFRQLRSDSVVCSRTCSRRVSYAHHRERRVAEAVAWGKANRDARVAISNQHKAQRRQWANTTESVGVSSRDWIKLLRRYAYACAYCGSSGEIHMEHVIPLSRGGRHAVGNVLPACGACNLSKQSCFVAEWKVRKARLARLALCG